MEERQLRLLEEAISDIGCWSWWGERFPRVVQVEFADTQLYLADGAPGEPPVTTVALVLREPVSAAFLSGPELPPGEADWPRMLREDRLPLPCCDCDRFHLTDTAAMERCLRQAARVEGVFGADPLSEDFFAAPARLVFWAGEHGFAAAGARLEVVSHQGDLTGAELETANHRWWDYWRRYWRLRGTPEALPIDRSCEVTIPVKGPEKKDRWSAQSC